MVKSDWSNYATVHDVRERWLILRLLNISDDTLTIENGQPFGMYITVDIVRDDAEEPIAVLQDWTAFYQLDVTENS